MAFSTSDIRYLALIVRIADCAGLVWSFAMGLGFVCQPIVHPFVAPKEVEGFAIVQHGVLLCDSWMRAIN